MMKRFMWPRKSSSPYGSQRRTTHVPPGYVNLHKMEEYLNEKFGRNYLVEIEDDRCTITASQHLTKWEIKAFCCS